MHGHECEHVHVHGHRRLYCTVRSACLPRKLIECEIGERRLSHEKVLLYSQSVAYTMGLFLGKQDQVRGGP